jgi:hypothetical protein
MYAQGEVNKLVKKDIYLDGVCSSYVESLYTLLEWFSGVYSIVWWELDIKDNAS